MEKGLLEKTGHDLEYWVKVVKATKLDKHKAIMDHLKGEHGFTHGFANFVALKSRESDTGSIDADTLVTNQYAGKDVLKPIYDELLSTIGKFGDDITITPKKDSVSLIRKRQFALIKPATKTRIDLGLKIKDKPTDGRLESSGPFGKMCTHRVRLEGKTEVDTEVIGWIKEAYEQSV
jgi:predicted transport protein